MIPGLNKATRESLREMESRLAGSGHRLTGPRHEVLKQIAAQGSMFSAAALLDALPFTHRVGRATIFRTLDLLVELQILERVHKEASGASGYSYVVCGLSGMHHHHSICTRCGEVSDIEGCFLDGALMRELTSQSKFQVEDHHLELYGTCRKCKAEE